MKLLFCKEQDEILSKVKEISTLVLKNIDIESSKACIDIISKLRDIVFLIDDNRAAVYFDNCIDTYFESLEWKKICRERIEK